MSMLPYWVQTIMSVAYGQWPRWTFVHRGSDETCAMQIWLQVLLSASDCIGVGFQKVSLRHWLSVAHCHQNNGETKPLQSQLQMHHMICWFPVSSQNEQVGCPCITSSWVVWMLPLALLPVSMVCHVLWDGAKVLLWLIDLIGTSRKIALILGRTSVSIHREGVACSQHLPWAL